jgi:MOSC domain-containing protein YiiM
VPGIILQINTSDGGVPKLPVERAYLSGEGLFGDRQRDTDVHGGPERALCLYGIEVIDRLRGEGHPIAPGTAGENVTLRGIDWARMLPGARLRLGGQAEVQLTRYTAPCRNIAGSFHDGRFTRISQKVHPGDSRIYARVLREGWLVTGDAVEMLAPGHASAAASDDEP